MSIHDLESKKRLHDQLNDVNELEKLTGVRTISNFEMLEKIKKLGDIESIRCDNFPLLGKATSGFSKGELVVITGETGCGKTLICQSFTNDLCRESKFPLWFTYEMPPREFLIKFSRESADLHFYMPEELEAYDIKWVEHSIRQAKLKYEIDFVFIDHLHYIFDMAVSRNISLDIGVIMRVLKRLAVELEIVIFIVCHITKARIEKDDDMGIHLIRDSSLIAQESDTVLFVHRYMEERDGICITDSSVVKVCKARRTGERGCIIPIVKDGFYLREV